MYRKCATERSVRNQRNLENALLELMQKLPYGEITVTQICETADVSRRVFYHLFGSKQDALYGLIDHRILDVESYRADLSDMALRCFLYWQDQQALLDALTGNGMGGLLLERMIISIMQEDYDVWRWLQAEDLRNRQDILVFNISGVMGLVFSWYYSGFRKTPEEMTQLMKTLMRNPLARNI